MNEMTPEKPTHEGAAHEHKDAPEKLLLTLALSHKQVAVLVREIIENHEDEAYDLVGDDDIGEAFIHWIENLHDERLGCLIMESEGTRIALETALAEGVKNNFLDGNASDFLEGDEEDKLTEKIHKHLLHEAENEGVLKSANAHWRTEDITESREEAIAQAMRLARESLARNDDQLAREILSVIIRYGSEDEASQARLELEQIKVPERQAQDHSKPNAATTETGTKPFNFTAAFLILAFIAGLLAMAYQYLKAVGP